MAVFLSFTWTRGTYPEDRGANVVRLRDEESPFQLGRSPDVAIRLEAHTVSRRHAEIRVQGGRVAIRDIGAINGIHRHPGDQRCQPFVWVEVPPLQPVFVTEYQIVVLDRPPLTADEYRQVGDLDLLLRLVPGPNVQARLARIEELLTLPALQPMWTGGAQAPYLLDASGVEHRFRPPLGDPAPFHHRIRVLLRTALENGLLSADRSLALVRDLLGDFPSEPVVPAGVGAWRDGLIHHMARTIDRERRYQDLPILADALEEADCDAAELLAHLRADAPHFPGCWAVELLSALPGVPVLP